MLMFLTKQKKKFNFNKPFIASLQNNVTQTSQIVGIMNDNKNSFSSKFNLVIQKLNVDVRMDSFMNTIMTVPKDSLVKIIRELGELWSYYLSYIFQILILIEQESLLSIFILHAVHSVKLVPFLLDSLSIFLFLHQHVLQNFAGLQVPYIFGIVHDAAITGELSRSYRIQNWHFSPFLFIDIACINLF